MTKTTHENVNESVSPMVEESLEQERRWLVALDDPRVRAKGLGPEVAGPALAGARARVLERMVRTLVHEQLAGHGPVGPAADGQLVVPLPKTGRSLAIECLTWFEQGLSQRFGRVHVEDGGRATLIEGPVELISVLAAEAENGSDESYASFAKEICDCVLNEALCSVYRSAWSSRLAETIRAAEVDGFWPWLVSGGADIDPSLFLEQWGAVGHPFHPGHKTKLGLSPHEVIAWSPEFEGRVAVRLAALRRTRAHVETMPGAGSLEQRLELDLSDWLGAWRDRLTGEGLDPADFVAVPVHPWQADNILAKEFATEIASGDLALLDGPELECVPTMSFRTVVPGGKGDMPHIKLPVAIRLTAAVRTISPRSFEMGPRISRLLQDILDDDTGFGGGYAIAPEMIGVHYVDDGKRELGRHLGALIRSNPAQLVASDEIAVPVAALLLPSPGSGTPLFAEVARAAGAASPDDLLRAYGAFADTLLGGAVRFYLMYGIGLESHQQNTLAVFGVDGRLRRFMVRDFGGIRIHRPTLFSRGRELPLHDDRLIIVETWDEVRGKLVGRTLQHTLGGLAAALAGDDPAASRAYWSEIAQAATRAFDMVRDEVPDNLWQTERRAVLDDDWPIRASARMRITGTSRDIFVSGPNPLAAVR